MKNAMAIYTESVEAIAHIYGQNEAEQLINIAFEDGLHISRIDRLTKRPELKAPELNHMNQIIERLLNHEPIQQIVGKAKFYGHEFLVNEHCLIPRPETEELVHLILKNINDSVSLLDIGTGSGCIPIALKKSNPALNVSAIDISSEALNLAKRNAVRLAVSVDFVLKDILQEPLEEKYDIIVSNPPYIPESERSEMSRNVLAYEPDIALFVPNNDPLLFYRRIAQLGLTSLNTEGQLFFEIHESYGKEVIELLQSLEYRHAKIYQDLNGKDRMVKASL